MKLTLLTMISFVTFFTSCKQNSSEVAAVRIETNSDDERTEYPATLHSIAQQEKKTFCDKILNRKSVAKTEILDVIERCKDVLSTSEYEKAIARAE